MITELAEALGFSPSTVSRALADHPRISQKTKELVRKKAAEVGFVSNQYSHILKSNRTSLIGLIVPDITLHFYARVVRAIENTVRKTSYSIVLVVPHENICRLYNYYFRLHTIAVGQIQASAPEPCDQRRLL